MPNSRETQIKSYKEKIEKYQAKLKELERAKEDASKTAHYKIVLGGDVVKAGIRIDSKDRTGHKAFSEYLTKYSRAIETFIFEYRRTHDETSMAERTGPEQTPDQAPTSNIF